MPVLNRRGFLVSLPALVMAPKIAAQAPSTLRIRSFNHVSLTVRDLARSIEFYQGLFGMPIQSRRGDADAQLRIGDGPHFLNLVAGGASATPKIDRMGVGVDDFDVDRIVKVLSEHGVQKTAELAPASVQVVTRGTGKNATIELHLGDPDSVDMQLVDPRYCGGTGPLGTVCGAVTLAPKPGLIALRSYSHCTVFTSDAERSNAFYKQIFGMPYRSYQGPAAPTLAIGSGVEFLMFAGVGGRGGAAPRPASINHVSFGLDRFDADQLVKTMDGFGVKPRESQTGPVPPLRSYITLRMANRGGAPEGTPELYLTDPDGILLQLQDVSYCGGAGALGEKC